MTHIAAEEGRERGRERVEWKDGVPSSFGGLESQSLAFSGRTDGRIGNPREEKRRVDGRKRARKAVLS